MYRYYAQRNSLGRPNQRTKTIRWPRSNRAMRGYRIKQEDGLDEDDLPIDEVGLRNLAEQIGEIRSTIIDEAEKFKKLVAGLPEISYSVENIVGTILSGAGALGYYSRDGHMLGALDYYARALGVDTGDIRSIIENE